MFRNTVLCSRTGDGSETLPQIYALDNRLSRYPVRCGNAAASAKNSLRREPKVQVIYRCLFIVTAACEGRRAATARGRDSAKRRRWRGVICHEGDAFCGDRETARKEQNASPRERAIDACDAAAVKKEEEEDALADGEDVDAAAAAAAATTTAEGTE